MRRVLLVLTLTLALPATASARLYDLPARAAPVVAKIKRQTQVPVLLPARIDLDFGGKLFVTGGGTRAGWDLELAGATPCGANACSLATFTAERGAPLGPGRRVRIRPGVVGRYLPLSCGGSCSPPSLAFRRGGVRYAIQAKVLHGARSLVAAARTALDHGPR
jgi:hypothetical protein